MNNKIFGIGLNKTGTTSLGHYFYKLGYKHYCRPSIINITNARKNINQIYTIADNNEMFEDWPWPLIYKELYFKYPESKFILTMRQDDDEWFYSLVGQSKKHPRTPQRLEVYGHYNPDESNKIDHINFYNNHNKNVINFFKENNLNRLLILKTNDPNKESKIYNFIGKFFDKDNYIKYPHKNKKKIN